MMPDTDVVRAFLSQGHLAMAAEAATFAGNDIAPRPEPRDDRSARTEARELLGMLGRGGWLRPILAQDLRGCCLVREALAAASPLADAVFALQALGSTPLIIAGGSALRIAGFRARSMVG